MKYLFGFGLAGAACRYVPVQQPPTSAIVREFFNSHVHANVPTIINSSNMRNRTGFELLSINVDYPDFPQLDRQANKELGSRTRKG